MNAITLYEHLKDFGDLFDRKSDPGELNNLWDKDKELRCRLIHKLCLVNMKVQSRVSKRVALT